MSTVPGPPHPPTIGPASAPGAPSRPRPPSSRAVLLADDDPGVRDRLTREFTPAGLDLITAHDFGGARQICGSRHIDGIICEYRLRDGEVTAFGHWLRQSGGRNEAAPLLVLSTHAAESDRVAALESGADDFVAKPFNPREVFLRLRRLLPATTRQPIPPSILRVGPAALDTDARVLRMGSREVVLTAKELALLSALARRPGAVWSRESLLATLWRPDEPVSIRAVDTHVRRLRRKLGRPGQWIETVRSFGYRLSDPAPP